MVLLGVMIVTGWRGPTTTNDLTGTSYRPVEALVTILVLGIVSVALSVAAVRSTFPVRAALSACVLLLVLFAADALPLGQLRAWLCAALALSAASGLLLPKGRNEWEAARCILVMAPFAVAAGVVLSGGRQTQALMSIQQEMRVALSGGGLAVLAILSFASAVEGHRTRSTRALATRVTVRTVVVVAVLKLCLLLALYSRLLGDFLGGEELWRPRLHAPLTWLHALIVAAAIAAVALRTARRPMIAASFSGHLGALVACLAVMEMAFICVTVGVIAFQALAPMTDASAAVLLVEPVIDNVEIIQLLGVGLLLGLAAIDLVIRRRLTSGNYLWLIAGAWLLPPLLGVAFASASSPTAWAAPGQVDMVLTLTTLAVIVARRAREVSPRVLMSLLVVPSLVLGWTTFWPDEWERRLLEIAVVAGVAITLWLNPKPSGPDERGNERSRALLLGGQLTILVLYLNLLDRASKIADLDLATQLAWLWLGVPLTAVLTARVIPRRESGDHGPGGMMADQDPDVRCPREH